MEKIDAFRRKLICYQQFLQEKDLVEEFREWESRHEHDDHAVIDAEFSAAGDPASAKADDAAAAAGNEGDASRDETPERAGFQTGYRPEDHQTRSPGETK